MKWCAVAVALLGAAAAGCTTTRIDTIETGLFENDPDKITVAYEALKKKLLGQETITVRDLECMGFDLKAPNIESLPGPFALKRIFGDAVFQDKHGVEKLDVNLGEFAQYRGYVIPYQSIETTEDRIYISKAELFRKGVQMQMLLLVKDDKLRYCEMRRVRIDTYFCHSAPLEGLIIFIRSPGKAALNLTVILETYQKPGLEYFIPIKITLP